jgi:hypothetical protein
MGPGKVVVVAAVAVIALACLAALARAGRAPTLAFSSPEDRAGVQAASVTVKGRVDPGRSVVKVGGREVAHGADGFFSFDAPLPDEENAIQVTATNGGKTSVTTLNVVRIYTDAERAEQSRLKAEAEAKRQAAVEERRKAQEEADAKEKAEQAAFDATKAGKICKRHPDWGRETCQDVADGKYWIGMSIGMLVEERGLDASKSVSNYGDGDRYQVCWRDWTPSCFYGGEDGIITSYN